MRPDKINWSDKQRQLGLAFLPRQRMHQRLWRWIVVLMVAQAAIAGLVLLSLQGPWRQQTRLDQGATLVQVAARQFDDVAIAPKLAQAEDAEGANAGATGEAEPGPVQQMLDRLASQHTVRFAAIVDRDDVKLRSAGLDPEAWSHYLDETGESNGNLAVIDAWDGLLLYEEPLRGRGGEQRHRLVMGISDQGARRALLDGSIALGIGLAVVALGLFPLARGMIRRWIRALHQLHRAIHRMAQGGEPQPVAVGGEDEIAYLALAFNDMAGQLQASRAALRKANSELERRVAERTEELRQATRELEKLATSDMLTGLANRRALTTQMAKMLEAAAASDIEMTCLVIDLDGFKPINDTLGHARGDELLVLAAEVFRDASRATDLVARLGGDEFVLLMPGIGPGEGETIANRLLERFREECERQFAAENLPELPSMSIGIASRCQVKADTAEQLLQAADRALYAAKQAGKSRVHLWERAPAA